MSGGIASRDTSHAFIAPPRHPTVSASPAAIGIPVCQSRTAAPNDDSRESHHRADRQVDAAAHDDRRQRNGKQPQLDAESRNLEEVRNREEVVRDDGEEGDFRHERQRQDPLAVRRPALEPGRIIAGFASPSLRPSARGASAPRAAR